jgi:hypothetical protein
MLFLAKNSLVRKNCETVCCLDPATNYFVPKVWVEVFAQFHAVAVNSHSSMRKSLFGLPGLILCSTPLNVKEK